MQDMSIFCPNRSGCRRKNRAVQFDHWGSPNAFRGLQLGDPPAASRQIIKKSRFYLQRPADMSSKPAERAL